MIRKSAIILLVIFTGIASSCVNKKPISNNEADDEPVIEIPQPTRAERVMKALAEAYPAQIEAAEFRNDDWAVSLRGKWYYFAQGRILPEEQLANVDEYRSFSFYGYPEELPEWQEPTQEQTERYTSWTTSRRQGRQLKRSTFFLNDLWQANTRAETESKLVRITFLGRNTRVHSFIQDKVKLVEELIREEGKNDPVVQTWINSIGNIEGYGWRNIADTQARSYHAYGLALDLLPRNLGGMQTYWLWTSQHREDWWNVSYKERYHPPLAVIKIFESHGFIWGGKWPLYDTMHFEYRPEILILAGITLVR